MTPSLNGRDPSSRHRNDAPADDRPGGSRITYDRVGKTFTSGEAAAVHDVSLTIEPGELVVILGPSGCGKTTLLKLTNRLYEATSGTISVDGEDITSLPPTQYRRRMGYVIQQTGLFPHLRIADNVAVVPKLLGWDKARITRRVDELLELVGLPPEAYRRRYPTQLSGGQQQRVGLARALAGDPRTLLMDEPFGALDAITRTRLQDELRRIHRQFNQTIVFVTHDIDEAIRLGDRMVVMRDGAVVQYDTPLRVVTQPADEFVARLVGSENVMRRLELQPLAAAIRPLDGRVPAPAIDEPTVPASAHARVALSLLLESPGGRVVVVDDDARPVGWVDLESIHGISRPSQAVLQAQVGMAEAVR
jgi:osmoprotectant transport system ATP-binding protein